MVAGEHLAELNSDASVLERFCDEVRPLGWEVLYDEAGRHCLRSLV
jgi:hypothetical protein